MTTTDYFFELITEESIAFSKIFVPIIVLLMVLRLVAITMWKEK